ncbi:MAG: hypothetical protein OQL08_01480 [Gammaproteobacteria bacterium]|nr:hypothetical protein [Gammaproteobacteria bacterium]
MSYSDDYSLAGIDWNQAMADSSPYGLGPGASDPGYVGDYGGGSYGLSDIRSDYLDPLFSLYRDIKMFDYQTDLALAGQQQAALRETTNATTSPGAVPGSLQMYGQQAPQQKSQLEELLPLAIAGLVLFEVMS